jgi:hypothetical protein
MNRSRKAEATTSDRSERDLDKSIICDTNLTFI